MASDYGLNFGFRRSDESLSSREGRFKTPATGTPLAQGVAVELDAANPGYLKKATARTPLQGLTGLLVQEESHLGSVFEASPYLGHDSIDLGTCKVDQLSVMWAGPGAKVWFKNTAAYERGNRTKAAVQMVDLAGVNLGDSLTWDGNKFVAADGGNGWMVVTHLSGTDYVEAVLSF